MVELLFLLKVFIVSAFWMMVSFGIALMLKMFKHNIILSVIALFLLETLTLILLIKEVALWVILLIFLGVFAGAFLLIWVISALFHLL